jgi:prepilin-type processing-associated H-X9-DG protein
VQQRGQVTGFLYVDGHVRVYHGQHRLPKAHVARMRLSLPATADYWINDSAGDPLFVITAEATAGLVQMLPPCWRKSAA